MIRPGAIDRLARAGSPVHRLPPAPKVFAALAIIVTLATWRDAPPAFLAAAALLLAGVAALARLPWRFLAGRLLILSPFILGLAALSLASPGGWRQGAHAAARSLLCLGAAILLAGTTPFAGMLRIFRKLHAPPLLVTTLALAYRYSFVLADEARRMQVARQARCFNPAKRREAGWRAALLGRLMLRSMDRSGRVHAAMLARGWR
jgi:cobalt/nickel transport system permease protein